MQIFDTNGVFLSEKKQLISENALNAWETLSLGASIPQDAKIKVFLVNETEQEAYFDELEIVISNKPTTKIVQENNYYPFGLNMRGLEKVGDPNDRFQYNAQTEKDEDIEMYETPFRGYQADICVFRQVDLLAPMFPSITPFHFGYNNPVYFNDPSGLVGVAAKPSATVDNSAQIASVMNQLQNMRGNNGGGKAEYYSPIQHTIDYRDQEGKPTTRENAYHTSIKVHIPKINVINLSTWTDKLYGSPTTEDLIAVGGLLMLELMDTWNGTYYDPTNSGKSASFSLTIGTISAKKNNENDFSIILRNPDDVEFTKKEGHVLGFTEPYSESSSANPEKIYHYFMAGFTISTDYANMASAVTLNRSKISSNKHKYYLAFICQRAASHEFGHLMTGESHTYGGIMNNYPGMDKPNYAQIVDSFQKHSFMNLKVFKQLARKAGR